MKPITFKKYGFTFLLSISILVSSQNPDINILREINGTTSPFLRDYSITVSNSTRAIGISIPVIMGVTSFITKDEEMLKNAIGVGLSIGISASLTYGLKHAIGRPRPFITWPEQITAYENIHSNSFPSGHTSFAFATATSLSMKYPKWYIIAPSYLWAGSVGYSRMNLGVHYPSDVLAGALLGAGSAYLSCKINDWLFRKINPVKTLHLQEYFL